MLVCIASHTPSFLSLNLRDQTCMKCRRIFNSCGVNVVVDSFNGNWSRRQRYHVGGEISGRVGEIF